MADRRDGDRAALHALYRCPESERCKSMAQTKVYAYRGWQSTGIRLEAGESAEIHASGEWLYMPQWHGDGYNAILRQSFYPLPHVPGGVLLGRVGESGYTEWIG